jgi:7,8-dihydropterin-6-yl-methyl-4-(beta-D-ribofuranosyl)aminobenzene 5'-phosphate synthase
MKLTIVYDNKALPPLRSGWGFSCLVENGARILFDTGADSSILLGNMRQLEIDPKTIDTVVLSHNHSDHTGGLKGFLRANEDKAKVYSPKEFSSPAEIHEGVYSIGKLGRLIKEQSLAVNTSKGIVVITGCAHPGLERIIDRARTLGSVYGVIGGFHGFSKLEKLKGIELIAPCHCTKHIQKIKQKYPREFREIKAETIIKIE